MKLRAEEPATAAGGAMTRDHIFLFAVALIWGSTITLSKELFTRITPVEFLLARYAFAFVPAVLVWSSSRMKSRQVADARGAASERLLSPEIGSQLAIAGILAAALAVHTVGIDLSSSAF